MSQPDLVCMSSADWDAPLWTNKQHLMLRLAKNGVRVLYIESLGLRRPTVGRSDATRMMRRVRNWRPTAVAVASNVLVDSPLVLPFHVSPSARWANERLVRLRLDRNFRRHRLNRPILWSYVPAAVDVFDRAKFSRLVYHCVDDLASYPGIDSERFRADERRLIEAADCVIASSRPLVGLLTDQGADEVVYWPNPADTELFGRDAKAVKDRLRPKLGFVGAVAEHKLDVDLIREVAIRLPGWDIELVGPVGHGLGATSISTTTFPENVRLLGAVERERLPDVVSQFDVAMVPYRLTPYTRGVFPMKVFEYLAAGRPVISTPLPSLVGEVRHVTFASEAAAFAAAVREAHASDTSELRKRRRRYADGFSWSRRTSEALDLLTELAA